MADFAKKLTVTFGAFSCTLSGFENPFPVMREVVDYFQALADRDPAFGAHPERPDTEKLRSLAENASGEAVGAEMLGDEIVLSSTDVVDSETKIETAEVTPTEIPNEAPAEAPHEDLVELEDQEPEQPAQDSFEHITAEHLVNEVFENLTTDDLYDTPQDEELDSEVEPASDEIPQEVAYVAEQVVFEDIEHHERVEHAAVNTPEIVEAEQKDDPEVWAAELTSDAPVEPVEQPAEIAEPQPETAEQPNDEILAMLLEATATEAPSIAATATHAPQERPVTLGFGGNEGLDATRVVKTSTRDERAAPQPEFDTNGLGIFETEETEFGWNTPEASAPKPATPEPFMLTPDKMIVPETPAAALPSVTIMQQEDPRDDLRAFAKSVGAGSIPELLEASAAYTTLIRGRSSFSRREILGMLDEFSKETNISQEARIKTFGALLRGGRIKRGENGDYEMTSNALSTYERRKAG